MSAAVSTLNSDLCRGVLTLPFAVDRLTNAGVAPSKIVEVYPLIPYADFLDRGPNGDAILGQGAALPKKGFSQFIELGASLPGLTFNPYAIGYGVEALRAENASLGHPVAIHSPVEPAQMPAVYKAHRWLVVTASPQRGTVGWPLGIAEAQASGVGVCVRNLRPDIRDYVGPSAAT